MDPGVIIIHLRQGKCSLEDNIHDFLDCALIDFFSYGLNRSLKPSHGPDGETETKVVEDIPKYIFWG